MNKEDFVKYEQAVALKELGFDWECDYCYLVEDGEISFKEIDDNVINKGVYCGDNIFNCPTLKLVREWLLKKYKYQININPINNVTFGKSIWYYTIYELTNNVDLSRTCWDFSSEKEALSFALTECINLLGKTNLKTW